MPEVNQTWKPIETRAHHERLTNREAAVMEQLSRGLTLQEVADAFGVSFNTTKFHVKNIYSKMGVRNRQEALASPLNPFSPRRQA